MIIDSGMHAQDSDASETALDKLDELLVFAELPGREPDVLGVFGGAGALKSHADVAHDRNVGRLGQTGQFDAAHGAQTAAAVIPGDSVARPGGREDHHRDDHGDHSGHSRGLLAGANV